MRIFSVLLLPIGVCLGISPAWAERQVGPTMCACPGKHRPLGSAATCEEACYGTSSSGSGSSGVGEALAPLIQQGIEELFKGEDPAVVEQRREEARKRAEEAARLQKEKDDKMDAEAGSLLGLAEKDKIVGDDELLRDAVASPPKPSAKPSPKPFPKLGLSRANFARQSDKSSGKPPTARVACAEGDANQFFCTDNACTAGPNVPSCCPKSHPYLNHCDCQCYYSNYDIKDCSSYTACLQTWSPK